MNDLNVLLFSYVTSQKSEFLVVGDVLLFLVNKYWFKQSKMPQYKERIVVSEGRKLQQYKQKKFRGGICPRTPQNARASGPRSRRTSHSASPSVSPPATPPWIRPCNTCAPVLKTNTTTHTPPTIHTRVLDSGTVLTVISDYFLYLVSYLA